MPPPRQQARTPPHHPKVCFLQLEWKNNGMVPLDASMMTNIISSLTNFKEECIHDENDFYYSHICIFYGEIIQKHLSDLFSPILILDLGKNLVSSVSQEEPMQKGFFFLRSSRGRVS